MVDISHVIPYLVYSILAGLVGTGGITLTLYGITRIGLTKAPMVLAVGSLFTQSSQSAQLVGAVLHLVSGTVFGMLYTLAFLAFAPISAGVTVGLGLLLGFLHGLVVCFFLVVTIAERHPLEEFRKAGFDVGLAHLVGHLVYGLLVGGVIALSGIATG